MTKREIIQQAEKLVEPFANEGQDIRIELLTRLKLMQELLHKFFNYTEPGYVSTAQIDHKSELKVQIQMIYEFLNSEINGGGTKNEI